MRFVQKTEKKDGFPEIIEKTLNVYTDKEKNVKFDEQLEVGTQLAGASF